jgi:hypothetical protein
MDGQSRRPRNIQSHGYFKGVYVCKVFGLLGEDNMFSGLPVGTVVLENGKLRTYYTIECRALIPSGIVCREFARGTVRKRTLTRDNNVVWSIGGALVA